MKNTTLKIAFAVLILFCFSCEKQEFFQPNDQEFTKGIIIFVGEEVDNIALEPDEKNRREKIKQFANGKLRGLQVEDKDVHLAKDGAWFSAKTLNPQQLDAVKKANEKEVKEYYPNYELDLHGRKPMMQGSPLPQGRKPMMQEDWRYNSTSYASDFVLWLGGGNESSPDPIPTGRMVWIMDTGIDGSHQDLRGSIDPSIGFDATDARNPYHDDNGHGTMIAGIIGARAFNQQPGGNSADIGINGIHTGAKLVSVKIIQADGTIRLNDFLRGLDYIIQNGRPLDVVNISLGKEIKNNCNWGQIRSKIGELVRMGLFVVFSAGNETDQNSSNFPSCLADGIQSLSVGSMNMFCDGDVLIFSSFSNYGEAAGKPIWLAPGEQIFSTYKGNEYAMASGTSFSAAMMSGIIYKLQRLPNQREFILRGGENPSYPVAKVD
jgi:hypothetical protein